MALVEVSAEPCNKRKEEAKNIYRAPEIRCVMGIVMNFIFFVCQRFIILCLSKPGTFEVFIFKRKIFLSKLEKGYFKISKNEK